jgi:predicted tellurium resistance membrane protein TerC
VLGIDNLVFITILAGRLPAERRNRARQIGLGLALITRLALLTSIAWIIGLTQPVFEILGRSISWRDVILIGGPPRGRSPIS